MALGPAPAGRQWNPKLSNRVIVALDRSGAAGAGILREPIVSTLLIVVLILVLLGVTPRWSYSARWGYGPSGIVGIVLIVIIVLALLGRI
jgi:hypothetical protein